MIDNFALAVSHGLLALAFWRLMNNAAVDRDDASRDDAGKDSEQAAPDA